MAARHSKPAQKLPVNRRRRRCDRKFFADPFTITAVREKIERTRIARMNAPEWPDGPEDQEDCADEDDNEEAVTIEQGHQAWTTSRDAVGRPASPSDHEDESR